MLPSSYIHVLLVNIRQGYLQMKGYALTVPTQDRPQGVLEGLSQIHQHNTLETGYRDSGSIFTSGNNSLTLGGESCVSMSASLTAVRIVMCCHLLCKGRLLSLVL